MIAKLTPKITYPFMVHWGFLYIKEDSGPTIDLLCAVNTNPAVPASIPIIINILPRFFLSMPFFVIIDCYFSASVPNVLLLANVKTGYLDFHLPSLLHLSLAEGNLFHLPDLLLLH